jgi:hypothetical protein
MTTPVIRNLVSSPHGDVPVDDDKLHYPLEGDPLKTPYIDYFKSIRTFLGKNNFSQLLRTINEQSGINIAMSDIDELIIRAEKHGALYHPASVEVLTTHKRLKFALNVAVTEAGRDALQREFFVLQALHNKFNLPYIPKPYYADELHSMVFLLEEWFEDYHEFHITGTGKNGQQVTLWQYSKGDRLLTRSQSFEIYRQAARILTLFYDLKDFRLIYPWHHAAGDFVVKIADDEHIDVRLTTVRGYEPFMGRDKDEMVNPAVALFYFLLHLSIQMRIDRLDGVGDVVWADDFCVDATVKGFFQGLALKQDPEDCCGSQGVFMKLLQSFSRDDLRIAFESMIEQYAKTKDSLVIEKHLGRHIDEFYLTLQNSL